MGHRRTAREIDQERTVISFVERICALAYIAHDASTVRPVQGAAGGDPAPFRRRRYLCETVALYALGLHD
jgi:hypothetical protein